MGVYRIVIPTKAGHKHCCHSRESGNPGFKCLAKTPYPAQRSNAPYGVKKSAGIPISNDNRSNPDSTNLLAIDYCLSYVCINKILQGEE